MFEFNRFARLAARFRDDRRGVFSVLFGILLMVIFVSVGIAIEMGRAYSAKSDMTNSLDAAVTSLARDITTGAIKVDDAPKMIQDYIDANAKPGMAFGDGVHIDVLNIDKTASTIEVQAHTNMPLVFGFMSSDPTMRVASQSAAAYSDRKVEIAMMLDVTGSMSGAKIQDLKKAANNAVATLLKGNGAKQDRVRIAIVPYADAVNVGKSGNLQEAVLVEAAGSGVVTGTAKHDDIYGPKLVAAAMAPTAATSRPDNCATDRKGADAFTDANPDVALVNRDWRLAYCPKSELQPLTTAKSALTNTINSFEANGFTAGHIGIQWTWYMLSEKWAGYLPASAAPADPKKEKVAKYAILMTDGEFNTAFAGNKSLDKGKSYNRGGEEPNSSKRAETLCAAMKDAGIEVFTIGFQLKKKSAKDVLADCASEDTAAVQHYYDTGSGAELDASFQAIARNIELLAITK